MYQLYNNICFLCFPQTGYYRDKIGRPRNKPSRQDPGTSPLEGHVPRTSPRDKSQGKVPGTNTKGKVPGTNALACVNLSTALYIQSDCRSGWHLYLHYFTCVWTHQSKLKSMCHLRQSTLSILVVYLSL